MRGKCVRQIAERKPAVLPLLAISTISRVRTYHTKKPSRFVHALYARPLKVHGGRGWSLCADGTTVIKLISLCSHPVPHQNFNREVRHSLTWHSSESESALERFEPVAVVQQLPDGRGSVFARVAARRQKVFKRGIDTYAKHVCRRRRDGSQSVPLFVLFVLFGQAKRTLKEKLLYASSRANDVRPLSRRRRHTRSAYVSISLPESQSPLNSQNKRYMPFRFFFCKIRRKRKSYQKENAERRFRTLRSATRATCP